MSRKSDIVFQQFIECARALKDNFQCFLVPFFCPKQVRCWKTMIYSLNMSERKRDMLWQYLNDDIEYIDLINFK